MTTPKGIRLRENQRAIVERFEKKTGFSSADYIRAGVDMISQLPDKAIIEKIVLSRTNAQKKT